MKRICSICKVEKDLKENFYADARYRGGFKSYCKMCQGKAPSQTPEKVMERVHKTRQRNRQFLWDFYKEHPCADCGEGDPVVLQLDHLDKSTKLDRVSALVHNTRSLEAIQAEIDKCEVVCANCHMRRTCESQGWYQGIDDDEMIDQLIAKTIKQQESKVYTYETLKANGLPVPPDLEDEVK